MSSLYGNSIARVFAGARERYPGVPMLFPFFKKALKFLSRFCGGAHVSILCAPQPKRIRIHQATNPRGTFPYQRTVLKYPYSLAVGEVWREEANLGILRPLDKPDVRTNTKPHCRAPINTTSHTVLIKLPHCRKIRKF